MRTMAMAAAFLATMAAMAYFLGRLAAAFPPMP
jgi:hypothetical protein